MKTKEEILDNTTYGSMYEIMEREELIKAMEAYASEQTEKYKELIKAYDELATTRNCMLMSPNLAFQSIEDRIEFNAKCTIDEENLCKKIEQLKKELP
jgi:hypothetical protein